MTAESTHEKGREGAMEAKVYLERMFRGTMSLPFNAYDSPEKLEFKDPLGDRPSFSFDLKGHLELKAAPANARNRPVEIFVEVKNYSCGKSLTPEYKKFLHRAASVAALPEHHYTWFLFYTTAPFGTNEGQRLCNGEFLRTLARDEKWTEALQAIASSLHERTVLLIVTKSTTRMTNIWCSQ